MERKQEQILKKGIQRVKENRYGTKNHTQQQGEACFGQRTVLNDASELASVDNEWWSTMLDNELGAVDNELSSTMLDNELGSVDNELWSTMLDIELGSVDSELWATMLDNELGYVDNELWSTIPDELSSTMCSC
eukprot:4448437-Amphidinium_carterae.1